MNFKIVTDVAGINRGLFCATHGLYILTSALDDKLNGQCLDSLMQVTNMPPRMAIGVGKKTFTHELIMKSGVFAANVIDLEDERRYDTVKHFGFQSGRKVDKFASYEYELGELGVPILPAAKAFFEGQVIHDRILDLETHTLFVADVVRVGERESGEPLTYNQYRKDRKKN
jgi:flavin reductase (DIM6/NTAB) family NADH-FMN oxidoreductase RutF